MEKIKFSLPSDENLKKVAAASLTSAVASLMASKMPADEALKTVHTIHLKVLNERTSEERMNDLRKLGGED